MKLTAGFPFWLINDGLPRHYPKLQKHISANVLIIGGGISGALTAYYLSKAGVDCAVVDGRTIGLGSTCASTCLLQYELDMPLHLLAHTIGKDAAVRSYRACGSAIGKMVDLMNDVGYHEYELNSSLYFSRRKTQRRFMEKEYAARKNAGFDVTFLAKDTMQQHYGLKAEWGILSGLGASIDAYSLTHHIFAHVQSKGVKVFDRTKVKSIEYDNRSSIAQTEDGFTIQARHIVNATGFEVVNFISKGIVDFYCTYAVVSEHQQEKETLWKDRTMMWDTGDPYLYMRLTKENRIIVGGRDERFSSHAMRSPCLKKKAEQLQKDFAGLYPFLSFKREFYWCGVFGKTKDSLPYIGAYPPTPHTYYALGFGGNGITFSVVAAEIIRDKLLGGHNEYAGLFAFDRR